MQTLFQIRDTNVRLFTRDFGWKTIHFFDNIGYLYMLIYIIYVSILIIKIIKICNIYYLLVGIFDKINFTFSMSSKNEHSLPEYEKVFAICYMTFISVIFRIYVFNQCIPAQFCVLYPNNIVINHLSVV